MDHMNDDVTAVSTSTQSTDSGEDSAPSALLPVGTGPILEKEPEKAVKIMNAFFEDTDQWMGEYIARWKVNKLRRRGVIGVTLVKPDPHKAEWKVWAPRGAPGVPPTFNKPARLCRRLVSNLFVDPPIPDVTPGGAADNTKPDAAEYQTRILQDITTTKKFNVPKIGERATSVAETYDSSFVRVYVDPHAGGSKPKSIMASQAATTVDDALYENADGKTPQPSPYVTRYVKEDQTLTDDPSLAARAWLPGFRSEILTGHNLRPIPFTATELEDCQGVVIRTPAKFGDLKKQYPDAFDEMDNDDLWELVGIRPNKSNDVLNPADRQAPKREDDDDPPPDSATIIVTMVYMGESASYPAGAYAVCAGTKYLLHRQKWEATINGVPTALPLPIAHFAGWDEGESTFYKYHLMHFLGPGQEVRAAALGGAIEHIDRFNRRKVFYTPQSLFQAKMGPAAMGVMVPVQQGSQPTVEEFPEYPQIGLEILTLATAELDDESGLGGQVAQGGTDPSVQSGLHAQKIIEQVNIGLGGIKRNTDEGIEQLWNIVTAFAQAYMTEPQKIRYRGDDQEYKEKSWSGSDFTDAKDVRIMKGSFTMLAPSAKLATAEYMRKLNLIDDNQLRMLSAGNIGGLMGLQDDPALLRIRRQITLWEDGPPKSLSSSDQLTDSYPGETAEREPQDQPAGMPGAMPGAMPGTLPAARVPPVPAFSPSGLSPGGTPPAQPVSHGPRGVGGIPPAPGTPLAGPPAPDPWALAGANVFKQLPNDLEPAIAGIRFRELSRTMCSTKFERQPAEWQECFIAEYQRMRAAAAVGTTAEAIQKDRKSVV